ncbi:hypothetical protein AB0M28_37335, partial [Streptomyces sp. NPDC051940]|uniref:hypothetical protein n=1 Tax=Streptomyces sp. NPDC051940 TaxID=3155675 RepID=UPI0034320EDF
ASGADAGAAVPVRVPGGGRRSGRHHTTAGRGRNPYRVPVSPAGCQALGGLFSKGNGGLMRKQFAALRRGGQRIGAVALAAACVGAAGAWQAGGADSATCLPTAGFNHCRIFDADAAGADFTVPAGVEKLDVRAWGQGGTGNAFGTGGAAAYVAGTVRVTAGDHLSIKVGGPGSGDAPGGTGDGLWGAKGGASTSVRTSDGKALLVAGGGGGSGQDVRTQGGAGAAGAENGQDAEGSGLGGKGARGAEGGAGGGNGKPGAGQAQGGAGGAGGPDGGGGGGAGWAGGGGGSGVNGGGGGDNDAGHGGGGSSHASPALSDVRILGGDAYRVPAKDDPFWLASDGPNTSGVGEGGVNAPGGAGRVVIQWQAPPAGPVTELAKVSGDDQTVNPSILFAPVAVTARGKDGGPVPEAEVTFAIEDPHGLGVRFVEPQGTDQRSVATTDDQGRAQSPRFQTDGREGDFTVRATVDGVSVVFTEHVKKLTRAVSIVSGDGQQSRPGEAFPAPLKVKVTDSGSPAAGQAVIFLVEDDTEDGPRFDEGRADAVRITTDESGVAVASGLVAGRALGTYTVVVTSGEAGAHFTIKVTEQATASPSSSPSAGATSPEDTQGQGGSGGLALTGAAGIGLLTAAAAALTALGVAMLRYGPRLLARMQNRH